MNYHRFDTLGRGAQFAVKHPFHGGKYENTIRQSPDKKSLLVPTAGDAILRLLATVVVDAIDADLGVSGYTSFDTYSRRSIM